MKLISTFLYCKISFFWTRSITETPKKDTHLLEIVKTTKRNVCSIFCLILQFFIKAHIYFLSSQALSKFEWKLSKDTAFTTL